MISYSFLFRGPLHAAVVSAPALSRDHNAVNVTKAGWNIDGGDLGLPGAPSPIHGQQPPICSPVGQPVVELPAHEALGDNIQFAELAELADFATPVHITRQLDLADDTWSAVAFRVVMLALFIMCAVAITVSLWHLSSTQNRSADDTVSPQSVTSTHKPRETHE